MQAIPIIAVIIFGIAGLLAIWKLFVAKGAWRMMSIAGILLGIHFLLAVVAPASNTLVWVGAIILWIAGIFLILGYILSK